MQASTDATGTLTAGRAATIRPVTLGLIVGNRDFFPDALIASARAELESLLSSLGIEAVVLDEQTTKLGAVETYADASKCAALFRAHAEKIDGVLVALPNFGDEKAVVDTLRGSGLSVPILVQAHKWIIDPSAPSVVEVAGGWLHLLPAAIVFVAICVWSVWFFNREAPRIAEEL